MINLSKRKKTSILSIIIILLLIIPSTTIIAGNTQSPTETKILSVYINDVDGIDYSVKKGVSEEEFIYLNNELSDFLVFANNTLNDISPGGKNITDTEWDDIEEKIIKIINLIKGLIGDEFPIQIIIPYLVSLINLFRGPIYLIRQPLLSVGIGVTWIPFYDYETFLGKMFRPIFMRHLIGFSITTRLNPFVLGFTYWHFGFQRVRTILFRGLLINFADLGINRIVGPQLLIGYGVFTGLIQP